jgi:hypothetical protein
VNLKGGEKRMIDINSGCVRMIKVLFLATSGNMRSLESKMAV